MIWQDVVIAVGQVLFAIALVPALRSNEKPPRLTCGLTGGSLFAFCLCYASLGLWWSAASVGICGAMWMVLMVQKRSTPNKEFLRHMSQMLKEHGRLIQ